MTRRTSLVACLCTLASFDAFADPFAQVFAAFFLGIGAGFLACIVVELAAGPGPIILITLAAWVIPALRLAWLLSKRRPTNK